MKYRQEVLKKRILNRRPGKDEVVNPSRVLDITSCTESLNFSICLKKYDVRYEGACAEPEWQCVRAQTAPHQDIEGLLVEHGTECSPDTLLADLPKKVFQIEDER
jgi:hypothetical protein